LRFDSPCGRNPTLPARRLVTLAAHHRLTRCPVRRGRVAVGIGPDIHTMPQSRAYGECEHYGIGWCVVLRNRWSCSDETVADGKDRRGRAGLDLELGQDAGDVAANGSR